VKTKPVTLIALLALGGLVLTATPVVAQEQPRPGGVLKVAMIGEPPSLDLQSTTAVITQQITWHVYETLYTLLERLARPLGVAPPIRRRISSR
jgi:peptide/nickel transport system substrate-binding protein